MFHWDVDAWRYPGLLTPLYVAFKLYKKIESANRGPKQGEGIVVLLNRWYKPAYVHVKESICGPDTKLLHESFQQHYLTREVTCCCVNNPSLLPTLHAKPLAHCYKQHHRILMTNSRDFTVIVSTASSCTTVWPKYSRGIFMIQTASLYFLYQSRLYYNIIFFTFT